VSVRLRCDMKSLAGFMTPSFPRTGAWRVSLPRSTAADLARVLCRLYVRIIQGYGRYVVCNHFSSPSCCACRPRYQLLGA